MLRCCPVLIAVHGCSPGTTGTERPGITHLLRIHTLGSGLRLLFAWPSSRHHPQRLMPYGQEHRSTTCFVGRWSWSAVDANAAPMNTEKLDTVLSDTPVLPLPTLFQPHRHLSPARSEQLARQTSHDGPPATEPIADPLASSRHFHLAATPRRPLPDSPASPLPRTDRGAPSVTIAAPISLPPPFDASLNNCITPARSRPPPNAKRRTPLD